MIDKDGDEIGSTIGEAEDACDDSELVEDVVVAELVVIEGETADVDADEAATAEAFKFSCLKKEI